MGMVVMFHGGLTLILTETERDRIADLVLICQGGNFDHRIRGCSDIKWFASSRRYAIL
jgi:hypothetical protein